MFLEFIVMDTVIIKSRKKSDIQSLLNFSKQIGAKAKLVDKEEMEDRILARIIEDRLRLNEPSVSREEIFKILDE
jgi:hypothetical protein